MRFVKSHFKSKNFTIVIFLVAFFCATKANADDLDLQGYKMTFTEDFSSFDASAYGPGTRWITHTPWRGDFGEAAFGDPGPGGPFSLGKYGLSITASMATPGKWHSGLISSMDMDGPKQYGFAQKYGYFEIKAKLPGGPGVWPAFWLIGVNKKKATSELDVMEYYGHLNTIFHTTFHVWKDGTDQLHTWKVNKVDAGLLTRQFNTYGVLLEPQETRFYLNRTEIWSTPTPPEFKQPMYILVDLAIGGGWPYSNLRTPQIMDVQYIHVYQNEKYKTQN